MGHAQYKCGAPAYAADKLFGSNVDVRTTLTFAAPEAAVQKSLPAGWDLSPPASGPVAGFNVAVVLIDSILQLSAEGNSKPPFRGAVLALPVKKEGAAEPATMVVYGIARPEGVPGAYGNYSPGQVSIERKLSLGSDGKAAAEEK